MYINYNKLIARLLVNYRYIYSTTAILPLLESESREFRELVVWKKKNYSRHVCFL